MLSSIREVAVLINWKNDHYLLPILNLLNILPTIIPLINAIGYAKIASHLMLLDLFLDLNSI